MSSEQGTHFWHMVIQTSTGRGSYMTSSYQGTRSPRRRQTRLDLFNSIRDEINETDPDTRGGIVLAFDIQPNKL